MKRLALAAGLMLAGSPALADDTQSPWASMPKLAKLFNFDKPGINRHKGRVYGLVGIYAPLAAKAREIEAACGSTVISGVRHTRVAGTRRMSLHASGRAVDMRGNPSCIYRHLQGWPGGYSTDYGRVLHVHISLGGREDGIRFAHHHVHRHTRYARR